MTEDHSILFKVCGMRDTENISDVATLLPDFMGFIFYKKSPRYVGEDFKLPLNFPSAIKRVGVFVNENIEVIKSLVEKHKLDYVQLHGEESVTDCSELKNSDVGVIKVFSVDENFDFKITIPYESVVDYFLFDTKGKFYGGNAVAFDWNLLSRYNQKIPFFLSGGLTESNISMIKNLSGFNLAGVDFNSGVEVSPGFKNIQKINSVLKLITTNN